MITSACADSLWPCLCARGMILWACHRMHVWFAQVRGMRTMRVWHAKVVYSHALGEQGGPGKGMIRDKTRKIFGTQIFVFPFIFSTPEVCVCNDVPRNV